MIEFNTDFENKIMHKLGNYKDSFFKSLITLIRNMGPFRSTPNHLIKKIIYKMQETKYPKGFTVLRLGEVSSKIFFVHRGQVNVYVY